MLNHKEDLTGGRAQEVDGGGHFIHDNGAPRMDTENGNIAVDTEKAGDNSDDNLAVSEHGDDSLIKTEQD